MKWVIGEPCPDFRIFNGGNKARTDIVNIAGEMGFCPLRIEAPFVSVVKKTDILKKVFLRPVMYSAWFRALKQVHRGDIVLLQIPLTYNVGLIAPILTAVKKRGVKIIAVLHDLDFLQKADDIGKVDRKSPKFRREMRLLKCCDKIIVHNVKMKRFMEDYLGFAGDRLVDLGIFDYLQEEHSSGESTDNCSGIVFAGNLTEIKSGFLYNLPPEPDFELYGANYQKKEAGGNVHYHGAFRPEELPKVLVGRYALVWDGGSCDTCGGRYGTYLRYNNPHKTSLYLSLGLPVIIWKEAALADFILEHGCGIAVQSLGELSDVLQSVDAQRYAEMKIAAEAEGKKLRSGFYTNRALDECLAGLE